METNSYMGDFVQFVLFILLDKNLFIKKNEWLVCISIKTEDSSESAIASY